MAYQGLNQPKPDGQPYGVYREQLQHNASSYSATAGADSDDFRFNSTISGVPSRTGHVQDTTAYPVGSVVTDNWLEHLRGKQGQKNDTNSNI